MDAVMYCKQEWEFILGRKGGRPGVNLAHQLSKDWADSANALVTTNTPNKHHSIQHSNPAQTGQASIIGCHPHVSVQCRLWLFSQHLSSDKVDRGMYSIAVDDGE